MVADSSGNTVAAVGIPLTGFLAYAPENTTIPTPVQGGAISLTLAAAFKKVGLLKEDGGFEWSEEPDGDPIEFWQEGYNIPSGAANVRLKFTTAENTPITRALKTGRTPDANGYLTVDGGGSELRYVFFSEEIYKNSAIRRRCAVGRVRSAKLQKSERGGTPQGIEFEIEILRHANFGGDHYGEWFIEPVAP